jgi:hypothetical protein
MVMLRRNVAIVMASAVVLLLTSCRTLETDDSGEPSPKTVEDSGEAVPAQHLYFPRIRTTFATPGRQEDLMGTLVYKDDYLHVRTGDDRLVLIVWPTQTGCGTVDCHDLPPDIRYHDPYMGVLKNPLGTPVKIDHGIKLTGVWVDECSSLELLYPVPCSGRVFVADSFGPAN